MIRRIKYALIALLVTVAALAQREPPPAPTRWVTDEAGLLSPAARDALDARLGSFQRATGRQVIVWVGRSTGGEPLEEWCARAFAAWGVGRRGLDDGVVLFVFADDHRARIEVGYGVEAQATDAQTSRVLRDVVLPRLRSGDRDGAITGGADALLVLLEGAPSKEPSSPVAVSDTTERALLIVGALVLLGLALRFPGVAFALLSVLSGRERAGGGFRGGGGRSGGGGASGRW